MIVLFTDFGRDDPYVGQMHAVLAAEAPGIRVIDLLHAVPSFDIEAGACLLPAYASRFPLPSVFVCVVDPGVGGERRALALRAGEHWYVGPDNGLLAMAARRDPGAQWFEIAWRPAALTATFHGRDLFAPVAARLARDDTGALEAVPRPDSLVSVAATAAWPDDLERVIYVDHYGNAITGMRGTYLGASERLRCAAHLFAHANTYSEVAVGAGFWYENANGLVEIAANRGSAAELFGLRVGAPLTVVRG